MGAKLHTHLAQMPNSAPPALKPPEVTVECAALDQGGSGPSSQKSATERRITKKLHSLRTTPGSPERGNPQGASKTAERTSSCHPGRVMCSILEFTATFTLVGPSELSCVLCIACNEWGFAALRSGILLRGWYSIKCDILNLSFIRVRRRLGDRVRGAEYYNW